MTDTKVPWDNEDSYGFSKAFFGKLKLLLKTLYLRYIKFRGNKVRLLRHYGMKIGKNCSIITRLSYFGSEPFLIELGDNVTVTGDVVFLTHDGSHRIIRSMVDNPSKYGNKFAPIKIGNNVFLGFRSVILQGTVIEDNVVVGAASLVKGHLKANSVYAGNPLKYICTLEEYVGRYKEKMVEIKATNRKDLQAELTTRFWGEQR